MSVTESTAGDVVVLAAVGLGALVLGRVLVGLVVRAAARGSGRLARGIRTGLVALRPGAVRRVVAAVLGIAAPGAALLPGPAVAALLPVADVATPMHATAVRPSPPPVAARQEIHVVHRGETLWGIARDHLPARATDAQVARAWPRWYAANRRVIGDDPSLIVPGQHLRVPGRRSAGTPTQPHAAPAPPTGTSVPSAQSLDPDRR